MAEDSLNQDQRMIYQQLVLLNNLDVTLYWTRNQLFFFIQSAGISIVATQIHNVSIRIPICILGIFIAGLWWLVSTKVRQFINLWHRKLARLERESPEQKIQVFNDLEFRYIKARGIPDVYYLMNFLIVAFIFIWIGLALVPFFMETPLKQP